MDPAAFTLLQEQVQALQAGLQAADAAVVAADAAAAAAATVAAQAVVDAAAAAAANPVAPGQFSLAPALANNAWIDYTTSIGQKQFKQGADPLPQTFSFADPSDLGVFLNLLRKKAQVSGWGTIFTIPVPDAAGVVANRDLISDYGTIPLTAVRTQGLTYYSTQTREAQDSFMSFQCLFALLETEFLKTITADDADYHLPPPGGLGDSIPSGPLLLKCIIRKAHVDTMATVCHIRFALGKLDEKMLELDSNIPAFNLYVKNQVRALEARGETTQDLIVNLFKGYASAEDVEFRNFIKRKRESYEEGLLTTPALMYDFTYNKYNTELLDKTCKAPTKEQEQILALTAQVQALRSAPKKKKSSPAPKESGHRDTKWDWKKLLPKTGEPRTREFEGKTYHVDCPHHPDQWVCHTVGDCSKNPKNAGKPADKASRPSSSGAKRLKAAKIAAALLAEDDDDFSIVLEEASQG